MRKKRRRTGRKKKEIHMYTDLKKGLTYKFSGQMKKKEGRRSQGEERSPRRPKLTIGKEKGMGPTT